ncbi:MAG: DUF362 domain-containing protein [Bacilli bacterium]|nr:DUF362 domain-containing protein [Acholeplasmataceae bacterium]MDY2902080.1 DUF362 domain-containing protein [Bacilli bacterium]
MKPKVYFSKNISKEQVVKMYKLLGIDLPGNVAIKVHSGEEGNQNYLHPEFYENIVNELNGTIVECNTAYSGERNTTEKHIKLLDNHGWSKYFKVDLLDSEEPDFIVKIPNGIVLKENHLGKNINNYDSMLVISHFKGHPMGGYGGALKQLSIGCASSRGKTWIHSGGKSLDQYTLWNNLSSQNVFLQSMADAASSVCKLFKGKIAFINVMCNMSVDCDCCSVAEDPCLKDIGILASLDPVAIDQACIDLVMNSNDPGKEHFMERVNSRNGLYTIEAAHKLNVGSLNYDLIEVE